MFFDINYKGTETPDLILRPDGREEPDKLHDYACLLKVKNPAIAFSERTKAGEFNDISDEDFMYILNQVKFISRNCFDNKSEVNIFRLCVSLMEQLMSIDCKEFKTEA